MHEEKGHKLQRTSVPWMAEILPLVGGMKEETNKVKKESDLENDKKLDECPWIPVAARG